MAGKEDKDTKRAFQQVLKIVEDTDSVEQEFKRLEVNIMHIICCVHVEYWDLCLRKLPTMIESLPTLETGKYLIFVFFYTTAIHTWYLSFFLHERNFWRIKFTPKNANSSR